MKILQINKYFYKKGGAETVFFNTIDLLEQQGHTVIPFCLKNKKNIPSTYDRFFVDYPELSESVFFTKLKNIPSFIYNKKAVSQLEKLIKKEKPDIAHIHLLFNGLSVSILPILKKHNIPIIMSVHDYRLVCPAYTFTNGKGDFCEKCQHEHYFHCILQLCYKKELLNSFMLSMDAYFRKYFISPLNYIDQFVFVSKFSMNKHIQINPTYKTKSTFLYNFTPPIANSKTKKGDYILYFGRISKEKGINTLIEVMKKTLSVKLKILGVGPLLEMFKKDAPSNVEFAGFKENEELKEYIKIASFVIVPSECYENNPMTIIEAYTIGTPVIGSNIGGIPELIKDGETGFLFHPKAQDDLQNVIEKALNISEIEYIQMSRKAKEFASDNFSEEIHYQKLIQIYQSVIK